MKEKSNQQKSKDTYLKKLESFQVRVEQGKTKKINEQAKKLDTSRNKYINNLIDNDLKET